MGASAIVVLCGQCRRETLPTLRASSWHHNVHRAAADDMVREPDPRAERIKERKARKTQPLRSMTKTSGFAAVAKLFLDTQRASMATAPVEDCAECARLQTVRRARLLGYDPTTHSAHVRALP